MYNNAALSRSRYVAFYTYCTATHEKYQFRNYLYGVTYSISAKGKYHAKENVTLIQKFISKIGIRKSQNCCREGK